MDYESLIDAYRMTGRLVGIEGHLNTHHVDVRELLRAAFASFAKLKPSVKDDPLFSLATLWKEWEAVSARGILAFVTFLQSESPVHWRLIGALRACVDAPDPVEVDKIITSLISNHDYLVGKLDRLVNLFVRPGVTVGEIDLWIRTEPFAVLVRCINIIYRSIVEGDAFTQDVKKSEARRNRTEVIDTQAESLKRGHLLVSESAATVKTLSAVLADTTKTFDALVAQIDGFSPKALALEADKKALQSKLDTLAADHKTALEASEKTVASLKARNQTLVKENKDKDLRLKKSTDRVDELTAAAKQSTKPKKPKKPRSESDQDENVSEEERVAPPMKMIKLAVRT